MFGCLVPNRDILSDEEKSKYQAVYCGLCREIRYKYGQLSGMTLTYDLTFLVILLNSLLEYEPDSGMHYCFAHPFTSRRWDRTENTSYAADMSILLSYYKLCDDVNDESSVKARILRKCLNNAFNRVREEYPAIAENTHRHLSELSEYEANNIQKPDEVSACFGNALSEIFSYNCGRWNECMKKCGFLLGRFIYVYDAFIDLKDDAKNKRYNPFSERFSNGLISESEMREILELLLGDFLNELDKLPLIENISLIRNILLSGVWILFNTHYPLQENQKE